MTENKLSAKDTELLKDWADQNNIRNMTITRGKILLFDLTYLGGTIVKRADEALLAQLASGLDRMRLSLIEKEAYERKLKEAQEALVLGMSHDLRTPLTGLFTYMEVLKKQDDAGVISREYLDKAFDKVMQIRTLSDQMFEYFFVDSQREVELEAAEEVECVFGDYLSEICGLLECDGYLIEAGEVSWEDAYVRVNTDYLGRIVNNVISNIEKYAEKPGRIRLCLRYEAKRMCIIIENKIQLPNPFVQGTGLGVKNIRRMMEAMHGTCEVEREEETYRILLWFPVNR